MEWRLFRRNLCPLARHRPLGYYCEQLARAGQPGMAAARMLALDSEIAVIAFARNDAKRPDAFTVVNLSKDKKVAVRVRGAGRDAFQFFRTTGEKDRYEQLGRITLENDTIIYHAPAQSTTTFFVD